MQDAIFDVDISQAGSTQVGEGNHIGSDLGQGIAAAGQRAPAAAADVPATGAAEGGGTGERDVL